MVETVEGLNNVEAIAAVKGVDVLHIGGNDLLANMGKPGKFDGPALVEAREGEIAACRKNGMLGGCGGRPDHTHQVDHIKRGGQFVTTQPATGLFAAAARHWACADT